MRFNHRFPKVRIALTLACLLLLAGCAGGDSKASFKSGPRVAAPEAEFDADHGAIKGQVLTGDDEPVVGAQVALMPEASTTQTAQDGGFSFSQIMPGDHTLFVVSLGFKNYQKPVKIVAGEVLEVQVQLVEEPVAHPRKEVLSYVGYMQCRMSTSLSSGACGFLPAVGDPGCTAGPDNCILPKVWTSDKNELLFKFTGPDHSQIVFESRWTPSTAATNPKMTQIFSHKNRTTTHWFANSTPSLSPLKFSWINGTKGPGGQFPANQPQAPDQTHILRTWLTLPFGTANAADPHPINFAYELRYEMFVTVFYSQKVGPDYTAWTS